MTGRPERAALFFFWRRFFGINYDLQKFSFRTDIKINGDLSRANSKTAFEILVEPMGFEPTASSMPSRRAPNCATAPPSCNITSTCDVVGDSIARV